jgi:hypothetical protein
MFTINTFYVKIYNYILNVVKEKKTVRNRLFIDLHYLKMFCAHKLYQKTLKLCFYDNH